MIKIDLCLTTSAGHSHRDVRIPQGTTIAELGNAIGAPRIVRLRRCTCQDQYIKAPDDTEDVNPDQVIENNASYKAYEYNEDKLASFLATVDFFSKNGI